MIRRLCLVSLVLVGLVLPVALHGQEAPTRPTLAAADIDASLRNEWFGVYLNGKKIGYFQSTRARTADGLRESFALHMKLLSFGKKAEVTIRQSLLFEAKEPYRLLQGEMSQSDGPVTQKILASRQAKGFAVSFEVVGVKKESHIGDLDYTLADSLASEVWIRRGPKVGDSIVYRDFDLQEQKIETSTSKILAIKSSLAGGVKVKYYEINTLGPKGVEFLSRDDDQGRTLSGNLSIFEIRLEPEEQAKNTQFSADLFVLGMAKVDRPLGDTTKVKNLILEVAGKEAEVLEDGPRQVIVPGPDGTRLIKLGKAHGKETKATPKDIEEALAETNSYPIHDPAIKELAKKAVGDAQTPEEKLRNVVDFVHDFIRPSLSANLPHIQDLLKRKKGDCKSYALMFTTLARAAGIPAREVSGLLYIGDDAKAFGGHAWNEVALHGVWVPIDASLAQTEVDATHICLGNDRSMKNLLTTLGKLSFKVVEIEHAR